MRYLAPCCVIPTPSDNIKELRYRSDHPEGTAQPNPFRKGTYLYRNFEKQTAYDEHGLLGSAPSDDVKIAGAGGSPGQPYTPPKEDPTNPYVPAPGRDTKIASGKTEYGKTDYGLKKDGSLGMPDDNWGKDVGDEDDVLDLLGGKRAKRKRKDGKRS